MHDASGCNSTYNTHDEPRWYDMDSLVFISGLSEMEAMLGDDEKFIEDIVTAANELKPRFITIGGTPIPMMMGTDFPAVARQIEKRTGIQTFGLNTDGMHSYISGISKAYAALAQHICRTSVKKDLEISVNILGATPLDFSINGSIPDMKKNLEEEGIHVHSIWAMDSVNTDDLYEDIASAGAAHVNLVISSCGIKAAKILWERFQIPYVIGAPCGEKFTEKIVNVIKELAKKREFAGEKPEAAYSKNICQSFKDSKIILIGEAVTALSIANGIYEETGKGVKVLCATDAEEEVLSDGCIQAIDEAELIPYLLEAEVVIGDPMYRPICPKEVKFVELPHEAFSGRIYRKTAPNLVTGLGSFLEKNEL